MFDFLSEILSRFKKLIEADLIQKHLLNFRKIEVKIKV